MRLPILLAVVALGAAAAPAAHADAEWHYTTTVQLDITARWSAHAEHDIGIPGSPCVVARTASGSTTTKLASVRPTRVLVMRLPGGRAPALDVGTGGGVPLVGTSNVQGSDETTHTGAGTCASANPPQAASTSACGSRAIKAGWALAFHGRAHVAPSAPFSDTRDGCPSDPGSALQWAGGAAPGLGTVTADVDPSRFYGTKKFTLHGSRTFTGTGPDAAEETVTIQWAATYRLQR
jgi:hypothetical protein